MSLYFQQHGCQPEKKYSKHGKTKQSQKEECDINRLLERSARSGAASHLQTYEHQYGNFADYDFESNAEIIANGQTIFERLPAEIKREFHQSPQEFFEFVTDEQNKDRLPELLPQIANQGNFLMGVDAPTQKTEDKNPPEDKPIQQQETTVEDTPPPKE